MQALFCVTLVAGTCLAQISYEGDRYRNRNRGGYGITVNGGYGSSSNNPIGGGGGSGSDSFSYDPSDGVDISLVVAPARGNNGYGEVRSANGVGEQYGQQIDGVYVNPVSPGNNGFGSVSGNFPNTQSGFPYTQTGGTGRRGSYAGNFGGGNNQGQGIYVDDGYGGGLRYNNGQYDVSRRGLTYESQFNGGIPSGGNFEIDQLASNRGLSGANTKAQGNGGGVVFSERIGSSAGGSYGGSVKGSYSG